LFLTIEEGLAGTVRHTKRNNMFLGLNVGHNNIKISMLQFVDDTLFICKLLLENILVIKSMLRCFELDYGLKVNFMKTKLGGIDIQHPHLLKYWTVVPWVYPLTILAY